MIDLEVLGLLDFETNKDRIKVDVEAPTQGDTNLIELGSNRGTSWTKQYHKFCCFNKLMQHNAAIFGLNIMGQQFYPQPSKNNDKGWYVERI